MTDEICENCGKLEKEHHITEAGIYCEPYDLSHEFEPKNQLVPGDSKKKLLWKGTQKDINELAEYMHERYEKHASENSWETQKITRVKFEDLPAENKKTMQDLASDILVWREKWKKQFIKFLGEDFKTTDLNDREYNYWDILKIIKKRAGEK